MLGFAGRDSNSHLFKHLVEKRYPCLDTNNHRIIEKGYKNNARKQKIAEVLLIKEMKPTQNKQDKSVELTLQLMTVLTLGDLIITTSVCI